MNRHDSDEIDAVLTAAYDVKRSILSGRKLDWEPHWARIVCASLELLLFASDFDDLTSETKKVRLPTIGAIEPPPDQIQIQSCGRLQMQNHGAAA
jgi:hypothetical protein